MQAGAASHEEERLGVRRLREGGALIRLAGPGQGVRRVEDECDVERYLAWKRFRPSTVPLAFALGALAGGMARSREHGFLLTLLTCGPVMLAHLWAYRRISCPIAAAPEEFATHWPAARRRVEWPGRGWWLAMLLAVGSIPVLHAVRTAAPVQAALGMPSAQIAAMFWGLGVGAALGWFAALGLALGAPRR